MYPHPVPYRAQNPAGLGAATGAALGIAVSNLAIMFFRMDRERRAAERGEQLTAEDERQFALASALMGTATATLGAYMFSRPQEEGYAAAGAAVGVVLPHAISFALDQRPQSTMGNILFHWGAPIAGAFAGGLVASAFPPRAALPPPTPPAYAQAA